MYHVYNNNYKVRGNLKYLHAIRFFFKLHKPFNTTIIVTIKSGFKNKRLYFFTFKPKQDILSREIQRQ